MNGPMVVYAIGVTYEVRADWMDHDDGSFLAGPFDSWYEAARSAVTWRRLQQAGTFASFPFIYVRKVEPMVTVIFPNHVEVVPVLGMRDSDA